MPNWCSNTVSFYGNGEEIATLMEDVESDTEIFSFESIDPTPQEAIETGDWYDWRQIHWGTKWDVKDVEFIDLWNVEDDMDQWCVRFDTAWGPPLELLDTLAYKYTHIEIDIEYDEPSNDIAGKVFWFEGVRTHEESYTSPSIEDDHYGEEAWIDDMLYKINHGLPLNKKQSCKRIK